MPHKNSDQFPVCMLKRALAGVISLIKRNGQFYCADFLPSRKAPYLVLKKIHNDYIWPTIYSKSEISFLASCTSDLVFLLIERDLGASL